MTEEKDDHEDKAVNHTISRNVGATVLAKIYYMATRLFIPPFVLSYVSLEEYGIWSYCFILLTYLGMSVFGITNVYLRYSAVWWTKGETDKINRLLSTGILFMSAFSLVSFPLIAWFLPYLFPILNIPESLHNTAYYLIIGTTAVFLVHLTFGAFGHLLQSMQMMAMERTIMVISWTLETAAIVLFVLSGFGIYSLILAYMINTFSRVIINIAMSYIKLPSLKLSWRLFDTSMLKKFLHFGGIIQLSGMLSVVNSSMEKIFAGIFMGVQTTGLYEVGLKFPKMGSSIPDSINYVFLSINAHLHAKDNKEKIKQIYFQGSRYINMLTGLMMGFFASFAPYIIQAWLGLDEKYQAAATILSWFTLALQMHILTGPISAIFRSIKLPSKELFFVGLKFILFMACALPILHTMGGSILLINSLIVGITVGMSLLYITYCNHYLGVSQWKYFKQVIIPGFVPYVLGFGIALTATPWFEEVSNERWEILFTLIIFWIIYTVIAPLILFFVFCHRQERKTLWKQFIHTFEDLFLGRKRPTIHNKMDKKS